MNYALIENNVVINIIWLADRNAHEFPNAVKLGDRPVGIGDTYENGKFYRDGKEVLTEMERQIEMTTELANQVVDLELKLIEVSE